jgi:hypothetical protein
MIHFLYQPYLFTKQSFDIYESANAEIVKGARRVLGNKLPIHTQNCTAGRVTVNKDDILIGHVTYNCTPNELTDDWVKENALDENSLAHPNTYLFFPTYSHEIATNTSACPFWIEQIAAARKIFVLCGAYWYDQWISTNFQSKASREVQKKIIRCNMGCETKFFPFKDRDSHIRTRDLLHISNLGWYKRAELLFQSVQGSETTLYVGSFSLKPGQALANNIVSIGPVNNTAPETNQWIINNCDFYIHTSSHDCQATTILENCARGLVPIVTEASGFKSPYAVYLTDNYEENIQIINNAITMSDDEYWHRSHGVREQISKYHSWERIYNRVWDYILQDQAGAEIKDRRGDEYS